MSLAKPRFAERKTRGENTKKLRGNERTKVKLRKCKADVRQTKALVLLMSPNQAKPRDNGG